MRKINLSSFYFTLRLYVILILLPTLFLACASNFKLDTNESVGRNVINMLPICRLTTPVMRDGVRQIYPEDTKERFIDFRDLSPNLEKSIDQGRRILCNKEYTITRYDATYDLIVCPKGIDPGFEEDYFFSDYIIYNFSVNDDDIASAMRMILRERQQHRFIDRSKFGYCFCASFQETEITPKSCYDLIREAP